MLANNSNKPQHIIKPDLENNTILHKMPLSKGILIVAKGRNRMVFINRDTV